jgi:hypothetical protein
MCEFRRPRGDVAGRLAIFRNASIHEAGAGAAIRAVASTRVPTGPDVVNSAMSHRDVPGSDPATSLWDMAVRDSAGPGRAGLVRRPTRSGTQ